MRCLALTVYACVALAHVHVTPLPGAPMRTTSWRSLL